MLTTKVVTLFVKESSFISRFSLVFIQPDNGNSCSTHVCNYSKLYHHHHLLLVFVQYASVGYIGCLLIPHFLFTKTGLGDRSWLGQSCLVNLFEKGFQSKSYTRLALFQCYNSMVYLYAHHVFILQTSLCTTVAKLDKI